MSISREIIEARIANLTEAAIDEKRIVDFLGPEEDQNALLDHIVGITEEYRKVFEEQFIGPLLPGKPLDDAGAALLGLPPVDDLLDLGIRIDRFRRQIIARLHISTEELQQLQGSSGEVDGRENMRVVDMVHTPPDAFEPPVGDGGGKPMLTEFAERLTAFRYLLYSLGIDPDDPKQVLMEIGRVREEMMRRVSYVSVLIKPLGRLVELCNQVGNRSFVWKSDSEEDMKRYAAIGKEKKKQMLKEHPEQGTEIVMSKGWMERMRVYLEGEDVVVAEKAKPKTPRILEDLRNSEAAADIVRSILETEGVLAIEDREMDGKKERVLVWKKTVSPRSTFNKDSTRLSTYLGRASGINGSIYQSFISMVPVIRRLYEGEYNREDYLNRDIQVKVLGAEAAANIARSILEAQGSIALEERIIKNEKKQVLVWKQSINPGRKFCDFPSSLSTYLGLALGIEGRSYTSFFSIVPAIHQIYEGRYDVEEYSDQKIQSKVVAASDLREASDIVWSILTAEGVVFIDERTIGKKNKRVLVWKNTINPQRKFGTFSSTLGTYIGKALNLAGSKAYPSFFSIVPAIRELFAARYDEEECEPNMHLSLIAAKGSNAEQKTSADIARKILESEGIVSIEEQIVGDETSRMLTWKKVVDPRSKLGTLSLPIRVYLGKGLGVSGSRAYMSFSSMAPAIRQLYAGCYDQEEYATPDIQFEVADQDAKQEFLRKLLEKEGIIGLEKRFPHGESAPHESVLVWKKTVDPRKRSGNLIVPLCTCLGKALGVHGSEVYLSFTSLVPAIPQLFAKRYDREEYATPDMQFGVADQAAKQAILRKLLEKEGAIVLEKRFPHGESAPHKNVLVWQKTIDPRRKFDGHNMPLNSLFGDVFDEGVSSHYQSFSSIVTAVRQLYAGSYDFEEWKISKLYPLIRIDTAPENFEG